MRFRACTYNKKQTKVEYLNEEMTRGYCYPHMASFCWWLLESGLYKKLSLVQLNRLVEYIGETEHSGDTNIKSELWSHLAHFELRDNCLICNVKGNEVIEDYKLYWTWEVR